MEANAAHKLKSAIRQVAEGNVFYLSSLSIFSLPAFLSLLCFQNSLFSLSPCHWMTFSSPFLCVCVFWLSFSTPSSSLSESAFDLASPSTQVDSDAAWLFSAY